MKVARAALAFVFALALLAVPGMALAQGTAAVTGTLTYSDRAALPANAVVTVQIADFTSGGAPQVISEQRFTTNGAQPPFRYTITYDPARVNANGRYTIQSNISVDGRQRYTTNRTYPVITGGNPVSNVNVVLVTTGRLPNTSGGSLPLLLAVVAAVAAVGVFGLRRVVGRRS